MTPRGKIRDVPASIRQRLLNLAREQGIRFNSVLQRLSPGGSLGSQTRGQSD